MRKEWFGWSDGSRADILAIFNTSFLIQSMYIAAIIKTFFPTWWRQAGRFAYSPRYRMTSSDSETNRRRCKDKLFQGTTSVRWGSIQESGERLVPTTMV